MRLIPVRLPITFICCVAFFISCKTSRTVEKVPVLKKSKELEDKTADALMQQIGDSSFKAIFINAKANVDADIGGEKNSFNISMRMKHDSVIWISISPALGIEVARVFITPDSIKFIDRINHKYKLTDYKFLNDFLKMNVDFFDLQGLLTGNLFAYRKNKFNSVYNEENKFYILSTLSKHKLKRSLEDKDPNKPVIQDVWLSDENYRITRISIEDERVQKSMVTDYSDFRITPSGLFPFKSLTAIKTVEKNISISIDYSKIIVDEQQEFPFSVPSSYKAAK